jgi:hypothetical protein
VKLRELEVPPAQSIFTEEDVPDDVPLDAKVADQDCGGLKTMTFAVAGVARSSEVTVAFS